MDRRVVGWSAGRHVDHPCRGQMAPWPAGKITECLEPFFPLQDSKKRPEPQICPKFVPAIVFGGSSQGDWNWSKICPKITVCQILTNFWQIQVPLTEATQNNLWGKFWTNLGFGAFLKAVRGKGFAILRYLELRDLNLLVTVTGTAQGLPQRGAEV